MNFQFPTIINEYPTRRTVKEWLTPCQLRKTGIALKIARKSWMRIRLAEAQNWHCCWCGCKTRATTGFSNTATIEHVNPRSKQGADEWGNFASACYDCNNRRGNTPVELFLKGIVSKDIQHDSQALDRPAGLSTSEWKSLQTERRVWRRAEKMRDSNWQRYRPDSDRWQTYDPNEWIESLTISPTAKAKMKLEFVGDNCA